MTERPKWFDDLLLDPGLNTKLKRLALKLRGDKFAADDLVVEAQTKAMRFWNKFEQGSNFDAWMCTILSNTFLSELRKEARLEYFEDAEYAKSHTVLPNQVDAVSLSELRERIDELPADQRQALLEVYFGYTYEEAAERNSVPIGTIKSRVNRAKAKLGDPELYIED